jgi:hypothetical protein
MSDASQNAPATAQPLQLSYISLAGDEVPQPNRENVQLLQHAADYQAHARNLRVSGAWDVVWGLIIAALAFPQFRMNPINGILFLLAALLIGIGAWILIHPTPIGMIMDGATYLVLATWNLYVLVANSMLPGVHVTPILPVLVCAQAAWGVQRINRYRRFANAAAMQPSAPTIQWLAALSAQTLKAKPKRDAEVIEFTRNELFHYMKCKGRLMKELAVFAMVRGSLGGWRDVQLACPDDVEIVSSRKAFLQRKYRLRLRLGPRTMKVVMPETSLLKLQSWIAPASDTARLHSPVEPEEPELTPA